MLGIAHVGFVRALEEAGVRFLGLGGTSAGANANKLEIRQISARGSMRVGGACWRKAYDGQPAGQSQTMKLHATARPHVQGQ